MVKEGIVLGHNISKNGIEVDKAKVDVLAKLPHPTTVKGVQSFLGHADFMGPFSSSTGNTYKLPWLLTIFQNGLKRNSLPHQLPPELFVKFLKISLRPMFLCPRASIIVAEPISANDYFAKFKLKYGVTHVLSIAYHPQTNRQVDVSNRGLKTNSLKDLWENPDPASWSK
ncbi:reverse transcriptase domain-containing protein [Tanacetum coccineum]